MTRYFVPQGLVDDRTDDCAFGAMMSLALRRKFRKPRFQMIADIEAIGSKCETMCARYRIKDSFQAERFGPENRETD